jgi:AXL receptor tyrosine kinase
MHLFCRDLAARNCLIDKKGRIKVADFGLSRSLQPDEEYFVQIKEVPVRWWAVEVFSNSPYTNKCDVWSYGVTIWEVFSKADTPYSLIQHNNLVIDAVKMVKRVSDVFFFFERND